MSAPKSQDEKEAEYQAHIAKEDENGLHPEGCFFCGRNHPSDFCPDPEKDRYWYGDD